MFSFNANKFRNSTETRYGRKPPIEKLNFSTENAPAKEYLAPSPIWDVLGITETEYYERFHRTKPTAEAVELNRLVTQSETQIEDTIAPTIINGTEM